MNGTAPPAQKQSQTFDNPGMTRVDEIDLDVPGSGGVFTTSQHTNNNSSSCEYACLVLPNLTPLCQKMESFIPFLKFLKL